ncbi:unnamed protein product [Thlaspi arvense]|uniref:Plasma membrane-associated cation-binding protein 1 n=1 Tax=Thlaspi arvense TaxID=13288 RepID=A0AAU9RSZ5_THLAR|nr:unnamed protein product [Thlaspi arvense]
MGYWKSRVVPTMKRLFERSPTKKALGVEATKTFDDSKETIIKEIEEKKTELQPKVVEIYEATSAELKALVREPKEDDLKKHSAEVQKFLEALVEIGFPGSKAACEILSTSSGPVMFIFEKVCVFLPVEEKSREVEVVEEVVKTEEPAKEGETKPEEITSGEKEIEIVEEKKEEVKPAPVSVPVAAEEKKPTVEEEKKAAVEEKKPAVEEEKKVEVEEKKPVEEVKKEVVAAAPMAEIPLTKAAETPAKAPETPAAAPQKA